jgi:hypothetical protein
MHSLFAIPSMTDPPFQIDKVCVKAAVGRYQSVSTIAGGGFGVNQAYFMMPRPTHKFLPPVERLDICSRDYTRIFQSRTH